VPDSGIGAVLVSSRSLAEYRAMFALSDADLRRRLLDCPGGAASLTAEVNSAGGDAIACDPVYASLSAGRLDAQAETDRASRYVRAHLEQRLDLTFHRDGICELMRVTREELRIFPRMLVCTHRF
jgi:hypothetical protein